MTAPTTVVPDFDHEMATTRRLLAVVPMDRADWKPHPKSNSLGALATHITQLAGYGAMVAGRDEVDVAAGGSRPPTRYETTEAMLAAFDEKVAASRAAIAAVTPEQLGGSFTLRRGEQVMLSLPRPAAFRTFLMSHMIHHRGQLSVYLRELDVPLPSIYGPTADS